MLALTVLVVVVAVFVLVVVLVVIATHLYILKSKAEPGRQLTHCLTPTS